MKTITLTLLTTVALAVCSQAQPQLADDFESYTNQAAFDAVWSVPAGQTTMLFTSTNRSYPSGTNSIFQRGGGTVTNSAYRALSSSVWTTNLYYRFYFYDAGASRSFGRVQGYDGGTWGGTLLQLLAIGRYNTISTTKYHGRQALGLVTTEDGASAPASTWFTLAINRSGGWHKAEIVGGTKPETGEYRYRYYIDDVLGGSSIEASLREFNFAVLGAGLSATGTGQWFDDAVVEGLQMIPQITDQPTNQTVMAPASVTMVVGATKGGIDNVYASNDLKYQWRRSGTNITGATSSQYTIPSTSTSDQDSYECLVSDIYQSQWVMSDAMYLTVEPANNPGNITVTRNAGGVQLDWSGAFQLQSNSVSIGTPTKWYDVPGVTTAPYNATAKAGSVFFRLRN